MFDQLVESHPQRERSTAQVIASICVHTVLIAASVQLTRAAAATVTRAPQATAMLLTQAPKSAVSPPAAASPAPNISIALPILLAAPPITVPVGIAPAPLPRGFDPARLGQSSGAPGLPNGIVGGSPPDPRLVATLEEVDEPAEYLAGPQPKYPPALRQVGIEGWVQLRFIVSIDGQAEPHSIEALKSSNPSFEAPAIDAVRQARFKPARIKSRPVRQLVEQLVQFTLH